MEGINNYIVMFGLSSDFTEDELSRSYRMLAKLYHPDRTGDESSSEKMAIINEGFRILKEFAAKGRGDDLEGMGVPLRRPSDRFYEQYKKGFNILQKAFDDYFGQGDKSFEGRVEILQERLVTAKVEFSKLINQMPYSIWVDDAIDKICSINRWLV